MTMNTGELYNACASIVPSVLTMDSAVNSSSCTTHHHQTSMKVSKNNIVEEVVPDSEEERLRLRRVRPYVRSSKRTNPAATSVVEILSDDSDGNRDDLHKITHGLGSRSLSRGDISPSTESRGNNDSEQLHGHTSGARATVRHENSEPLPQACIGRAKNRVDNDIIDLTVSSSDDDVEVTNAFDHNLPRTSTYINQGAQRPESTSVIKKTQVHLEKPVPLFVDDSEEDLSTIQDDSIMILNEPKSARRPIRLASIKESQVFSGLTPTTSFPRGKRIIQESIHTSTSDEENEVVTSPSPPSFSLNSATGLPLRQKRIPRLSKKALLAAEQTRREEYANMIFTSLNKTVFENRLSADTPLVWNKRLLSTAGRAQCKRDRHGMVTAFIELSTKVLDSDERIRNTLSHEMCHLACWIINNQLRENHGLIFRSWAEKVMALRSDIEISTKHNYEITYKYEWKCADCDKIYGRYSKSIDPDKYVCGACKIGKLIPLFAERSSTPRRQATSRMAAATTRNSPQVVVASRIPPLSSRPDEQETHNDSANDVQTSDVELLVHAFGKVTIDTQP